MDATLGPLACRLAGFWRQPAAPAAAASSRILVIRPGGMGDMILLIPVLRRLRRGGYRAVVDTEQFHHLSALLAHLAVVLGVRTVVLFGPGDPLKWGLEDARHGVIRQKRPCAPCALFGYQKSCPDRKCLREIGVERVKEAVQGLLADPDGISA